MKFFSIEKLKSRGYTLSLVIFLVSIIYFFMSDLGALSRADILRQLARQDDRIRKLEAILQGQAVKGVKIDQIKWNQAYGGSAVFGGQGDEAGRVEVRDESSNLAVLLNKDGVEINNGKLAIRDSGNSLVMDASGLVSTNNFDSGSITDFNLNSTTSTSYVDLAGSEFPQFTLTRDTKFWISVNVFGRNPNFSVDNSYADIGVYDNSTLIMIVLAPGAYDGSGMDYAFTSSGKIFTLAAGDHILKLKYRVSVGGTGSARTGGYYFDYIKLGS